MKSFLGKLEYIREEVEALIEGASAMIPMAINSYKEEHGGLFPPVVSTLKNNPLFQDIPNIEAITGKVLIQSTEATTRTGGSFAEAARYLGLWVSEKTLNSGSRGAKGESPLDDAEQHALQGMNLYILRSSIEGEPRFIAEKLDEMGYQISVINAGDGSHFHPSQALLDLLTIWVYRGSFDNLTIGFAGDLKEGRTVHSDVRLIKPFNPKVVLVPFGGLGLTELYRDGLDIIAEGEGDLSLLQQCDVIYFTRVQRERIAQQLDFEAIERSYVVDRHFLEGCKPDVLIMHPGPRITEISDEIRRDPRVIISSQAWFGIPSRIFLVHQGISNYQPVEIFSEGEVDFDQEEMVASQAPKRAKYYNPVEKGMVLDHLPPNSGEKIVNLLRRMDEFDSKQNVTVSHNVPTSKTENKIKDVILLRGGFISDRAAAVVTMMAPKATINVIGSDGLLKKRHYKVPTTIRGLGRCLNPKCITNHDGECEKRFIIQDGQASCYWCDRSFGLKDILN